jgi:hypothetical protein
MRSCACCSCRSAWCASVNNLVISLVWTVLSAAMREQCEYATGRHGEEGARAHNSLQPRVTSSVTTWFLTPCSFTMHCIPRSCHRGGGGRLHNSLQPHVTIWYFLSLC